ncbi:hypothetical protein EVAR_92594_1 [Eumeta japonica]|uniref:Uncharacterized protein n=1 Tax=Eumeta variegata TaxID=151549 RepID=A0A4C1SWQ5_EUMVA|nr:hypothetical protein EVAR_92594_1 [Eumeta japonica]
MGVKPLTAQRAKLKLPIYHSENKSISLNEDLSIETSRRLDKEVGLADRGVSVESLRNSVARLPTPTWPVDVIVIKHNNYRPRPPRRRRGRTAVRARQLGPLKTLTPANN